MQNGKGEQPLWTQTAIWANKKLVLHVQLMCGSLSVTTPLSHLANEFDVWSELHGQLSLAAVNQILCHSWGYERFQSFKDSLKACFENVNIHLYIIVLSAIDCLCFFVLKMLSAYYACGIYIQMLSKCKQIVWILILAALESGLIRLEVIKLLSCSTENENSTAHKN